MMTLMSETPSTLEDLVSPLMEPEFLGLLGRRETAGRYCTPGATRLMISRHDLRGARLRSGGQYSKAITAMQQQ
jgi:hypothetical protein